MSFVKYLLIACCALMPALSFAQTGSLKGTVTEEGTDQPLIGATIAWWEDGKHFNGVVTDDNGNFFIKKISVGEKEIQINYIGYEAITQKVVIKEGEVSEVKVLMHSGSVNLTGVEIVGLRANSIKQLTGAATKIDAREVELIKPIGTQEMLQHIPGVHGFADDGMGNSRISIGIRGLNPRRSSRVLILEDGIPIQPAIYVYSNMYYNPPVERLDEVEVIKGSGAIKYGPQTMGGVINYITTRPRRHFGGSVQLTAGENNYRSVFTTIGGFGNDIVQPEIQFLYKSADGYRDNNHFDQFNGTFKLKILPNDKSDIYIKGNVNHENSDATYTGLTEYSFENNPRFNPKEFDNFKVFRASLDLIRNKYFSSGFVGTTKLYTNYFDRKWWREDDVFVRASDYYDNDDSLTPVPWYTSGDLVRTGGGETARGNLRTFYVFGVEQSYNWEHSLFGNKSHLEFGGRVHWDRFIDDKKMGDTPDAQEGVYYTGNPDSGDVVIVGQSHHYQTFAVSAFLMEKLHVGKHLVLAPGVRFEGFEQERIDRLQGSKYVDRTTLVVLPGLGFNYEFKNLNLFGGIHRGFTPPSSGTLNILNFGANVNDSLDLEAEKSWNSELGLRGFTKAVTFEVAGFHLYIQDLVAAGRGTVFKNLGVARSMGVETYMHVHLGRAKSSLRFMPDLHLTYTFMDTRIVEGVIQSSQTIGDINISGNEMPYAPAHTLTAGISKKFDFGLQLRFDFKYVSEAFTDFENFRVSSNRGDQGPIPAYTLFDASIQYKLNKHWNFFATGKNIFDNIYIGSRLHSNPGQPEAWLSSGIMVGPRRQVNLGVRYSFGSSE